MAVETIGVEFEHHRAFALGDECFGAFDRVADGQRIHAVDDFRVHVAVGETGGAADERVHAADFAVGTAGHAVVIVDQAVDDRKTEVDAGEFRIGELALAGPVEGLEHDAVGIRAVAGERADDFALFGLVDVDTGGHGRARGDRDAAADDRVRAEVTHAEVRNVHAAAAAFAVTGFLTEQFGDRAVDVVFHDRIAQFLAGEARIFRAAFAQLGVVHAHDRMETLGDGVAVAAVRGGDLVGDLQRGADARRRGFLTDRQVGRAAVFVVGQLFISAVFQLQDHFFEFTDHQHGFVNFSQFVFLQIPGFEFLLEILVVQINRNRIQFHFSGFEIRTGIVDEIAHFFLLCFFMGFRLG